jgi:hypothetical protein
MVLMIMAAASHGAHYHNHFITILVMLLNIIDNGITVKVMFLILIAPDAH